MSAAASSPSESHYDKVYVKEGKVEQVYNVPRGVTLLDMKTHIAGELELKPEYLKLLHKGKVLAPDESSLNKLGIRYGSKMMLMRTEEYHQDKPTIDKIHQFSAEILALEQQAADKKNLTERNAVILDEQLTRLLERIDGIETNGRPTLRAMRKNLVLRCQQASEAASKNKIKESSSPPSTPQKDASSSEGGGKRMTPRNDSSAAPPPSNSKKSPRT